MKTIKSNDILESFGMKDLKLEELMEIDSGLCLKSDGCGLKIGCSDKGPVCAPNFSDCPARIVECTSKSFICTMKIN